MIKIVRKTVLLLSMISCIVIVVTVPLSMSAKGLGTKLDVKTSFDEKSDIRHLKAGLIASLKACPLYEVGEIGEDYSLWITNASRTAADSGRYSLKMTLELRTPAMLTRGKLIQMREIEVVYDPLNEAEQSLLASQTLPVSTITTVLLNTLGNQTMAYAAGMVMPGNVVTAAMMAKMSEFVGHAISSMGKYTPTQQLEGLLVGPECIEAVTEMLIEARQ
jgi:hypothetical protein